jgi:hypothetical protein
MTGMIGALIYLQKARISPDAAFSVLDWTAYVIFIVVIGGIGTMEGPVIGAIVFYLMQRYLADFGASYLILLGALGILVMLFAPKGLWGLVSERYGLTLFPTRRRTCRSAPVMMRGGHSGHDSSSLSRSAIRSVRDLTNDAFTLETCSRINISARQGSRAVIAS